MVITELYDQVPNTMNETREFGRPCYLSHCQHFPLPSTVKSRPRLRPIPILSAIAFTSTSLSLYRRLFHAMFKFILQIPDAVIDLDYRFLLRFWRLPDRDNAFYGHCHIIFHISRHSMCNIG